MKAQKKWRLVGTLSWTGTENIDGSFEQGCDINERFEAPTKPAAIRMSQRFIQTYNRHYGEKADYRMTADLFSAEPVWSTQQGKKK
jgi:hypothetical protein